jgi:hypothetical protein
MNDLEVSQAAAEEFNQRLNRNIGVWRTAAAADRAALDPTPEQSAAFGNVVMKNIEPGVLDGDPSESIKDAVKEAAEIRALNRAKRYPDGDWRSELADLERRCVNAWTEEQAKQAAEAVTRQHNDAIRAVEKDIAHKRDLLATPFLDLSDQQAIQRQIERLEGSLPEMRRLRERAIKIAGSAIKTSQEVDKLRPRLQELRRREAQIDEARASVKNEDGNFRLEPSRGAHRTPAALHYEK